MKTKIEICAYGCGQSANFYFSVRQKPCCAKTPSGCPEIKRKQSEALKSTLFEKFPIPQVKVCTGCQKELPNTPENFYTRKDSKQLLPKCIDCVSKRNETWADANREKTNAAQRKRWIKKMYFTANATLL